MLLVVKRSVERAITLSGLPRLGRFVNRSRALVLMYHNVVPSRRSAIGDRSLHLPHDEFARQLDYLQSACDVLSLEELIEGDASRRERCRVAITFDDAYLGAVSLGVEELVRRRLPATIFVPPGALGKQMWWDVLGANGLDDAARAGLLQEFKGRDEEIRRRPEWSRGDISLPPEVRLAREAELDVVASKPGITLGAHTWTHPNLTVLDDVSLDEELRRPLNWLRERYANSRPYVTYPYGLSSPRVENVARRVGYQVGFRASGGWYPADGLGNRFTLPRFDVSSGLSLDGLRLRLAGFGLR